MKMHQKEHREGTVGTFTSAGAQRGTEGALHCHHYQQEHARKLNERCAILHHTHSFSVQCSSNDHQCIAHGHQQCNLMITSAVELCARSRERGGRQQVCVPFPPFCPCLRLGSLWPKNLPYCPCLGSLWPNNLPFCPCLGSFSPNHPNLTCTDSKFMAVESTV